MLPSEAQYEHDCVAQRHNHDQRQDGAGHAHLQSAGRSTSTEDQVGGIEPGMTSFLAMSGAR